MTETLSKRIIAIKNLRTNRTRYVYVDGMLFKGAFNYGDDATLDRFTEEAEVAPTLFGYKARKIASGGWIIGNSFVTVSTVHGKYQEFSMVTK